MSENYDNSANIQEVAAPETVNDTYTEALQDPGLNWEEMLDDGEGETEAEESANNSEEVAEPQQSAEDNAAFAKIRREYEAKLKEAQERSYKEALDYAAQNIYGPDHDIKSWEDLEKARKEVALEEEAEQAGLDPEIYANYKRAMEENARYRQEQNQKDQIQQLKSDPVRGELFSKYESEIQEIAANYGVDYRTAFTSVMEQHLDEIIGTTQNKTMQQITKNGRTSPGPLTNATKDKPSSAWDIADKDFAKLVEKAKRGDLRKS